MTQQLQYLPMAPEAIMEAGLLRARQTAARFGALDAQPVIDVIVRWGGIYDEAVALRDEHKPEPNLTEEDRIKAEYGEDAFDIDLASLSGRTYEVYAHDQWVKAYWSENAYDGSRLGTEGWATADSALLIPTQDIEAAREC